MHVLLCTDGGRAARAAVSFGGRIARACDATATVLAVVERSTAGKAAEAALDDARGVLRGLGLETEAAMREGRRADAIAREAERTSTDLVVVGAERRGPGSGFPVSPLAYRILRSVAPPVLVVPTDPGRLERVLVCSSGRRSFLEALDLPARIAARTGAEPTLLHVLPEAPRMYGELGRAERGREWLRRERSRLTEALEDQLRRLEREVGPTGVSVRHGLVTDEILRELDRGEYDLVVTGSVPEDTSWPAYVMGDVTRELLHRADHPVLVVRTAGIPSGIGGVVRRLAERLFGDSSPA